MVNLLSLLKDANNEFKTRARVIAGSMLLATLFAGAIPSTARAADHYISPGQSIQPVVDSAASGDTIIFRGGEPHNVPPTYGIKLDASSPNDLTFRGEDDAEVDCQQLGRGWTITNPDGEYRIIDLTIKNGETQTIDDDPASLDTTGGGAVLCTGGTSVTIVNCDLLNNKADKSPTGRIADGGGS